VYPESRLSGKQILKRLILEKILELTALGLAIDFIASTR
jgi:hypothetical protein